MTKKGRFKKLVRARMAQTGEPYRAARAHLLGRPRPRQHSTGGAAMYPYERFTEKAKRVLTLAQEDAERAHHSYIGTEHLLIGLLGVEDGLAARVLTELGVNQTAVRKSIDAVLGRNERIIIQQIIPTSRVKKVIDIAFEQARELGHNYVGTEHLLLGILIEGEGIAAHVLKDLGASLGSVRPVIVKCLAEMPAELTPRPALRFDEEVRAVLHRAEAFALEAGMESIGLDQLRQALEGPA